MTRMWFPQTYYFLTITRWRTTDLYPSSGPSVVSLQCECGPCVIVICQGLFISKWATMTRTIQQICRGTMGNSARFGRLTISIKIIGDAIQKGLKVTRILGPWVSNTEFVKQIGWRVHVVVENVLQRSQPFMEAARRLAIKSLHSRQSHNPLRRRKGQIPTRERHLTFGV